MAHRHLCFKQSKDSWGLIHILLANRSMCPEDGQPKTSTGQIGRESFPKYPFLHTQRCALKAYKCRCHPESVNKDWYTLTVFSFVQQVERKKRIALVGAAGCASTVTSCEQGSSMLQALQALCHSTHIGGQQNPLVRVQNAFKGSSWHSPQVTQLNDTKAPLTPGVLETCTA